MPVATNQIASGVIGNKIIVVGGWLWSYSYPYTTVQIYDPETDIWTREADAPFLRACVAGEVVNNRLYVIGGTDRPHPCVALSTVFEFGPLVDFNADGKVDIQDLLRLIESWGKDDPSVDMGPMPWGDGKVDANDLEVLMSYWQQEILDPALAAYWKLDEAEGNIANDIVGDNHGTIYGDPIWQPESGKKDGALAFDGIDDYVETGFVLDPAGGAFSVLAWIQGGAPGQVIISQTDGPSGAGEIWLGADAVEGKLMTKLRSPSGRSPAPPMVADAVITDGQWHHVGIVVAEQKVRHLYVDGIRAAFDTQPVVLPSSDGGLYFGAGKTLDAEAFFSGLIDDVRIYNVALSTDKIAALVH